MPLTISIQDEHGKRMGEFYDLHDSIVKLRSLAEEAGRPMRVLHFVDPYGDTVLNSIQQEAALLDVDELKSFATTESERSIVEELRRCLAEAMKAGTYIKFIGD
jgi:hypothetical protein